MPTAAWGGIEGVSSLDASDAPADRRDATVARTPRETRALRSFPAGLRGGTLLVQPSSMRTHPLTVRDYMSPCVHSIGKAQTLATAHSMMRKWQVRHLPVLEGGKVIGLLSLRDLHLVETLRDVDPGKVSVQDAMTPEPYMIAPDADLRTVAVEMATRKLGSALVARGGKVVGIFTTVDALRALFELLDEADRPAKPRNTGASHQEDRS
jgi:acetoin utilization protein AcuB